MTILSNKASLFAPIIFSWRRCALRSAKSLTAA